MIIVISERVNQVRNWTILLRDILDKELINQILPRSDGSSFSGITDVPRVKSESIKDNDKKITKVAQEGTPNILDSISDKCKLCAIFTYFVYEGVERVKYIKEDEKTCQYFLMEIEDFNEKQLKL